MKHILIIICTIFMTISIKSSLLAQEYDSTLGLRIGKGIFASYKKTIRDDLAIELFTGVNSLKNIDYYAIGILLQLHNNLGPDRLYWYYGGGTTIAITEDSYIGLTLNTGIDYTLDNLPINISFDYAPILSFNNGIGFDWTNAGISLRFVIQ